MRTSALLLVVALASLPPASAGVSAGGSSACSSLTMTCQYRSQGFHTGLPGDVGLSSWGASHGACTITLSHCRSDGLTAVAPHGTCMPYRASTHHGTDAESVEGTWCLP